MASPVARRAMSAQPGDDVAAVDALERGGAGQRGLARQVEGLQLALLAAREHLVGVHLRAFE